MTSRWVMIPRRVADRSRRAMPWPGGAVRLGAVASAPAMPAGTTTPGAADGAAIPGDRKLRDRLVWQGARLDPVRPAEVWRSWANAALRTRADVETARRAVAEAGLHPHADDPKNWDSLLALGMILDRFAVTARVLDAGATLYSRLLPWLYLYGYRALHGIDLTFVEPVELGPIRYERMDLTATSFAPASFDAIACLSVIEHGVPIDDYLAEAARLLRPGGLLITSTDFWCEPIVTQGREAYGVAAKVFTPAELERLVVRARAFGLRPTSRVDLACEDRVVRWERMDLDFTFATIVLERDGPRPWSRHARAARRWWAARQLGRASRSTSAT